MTLQAETATRIVNDVRGIDRVVYDVTHETAGDDRVDVTSFVSGGGSRWR